MVRIVVIATTPAIANRPRHVRVLRAEHLALGSVRMSPHVLTFCLIGATTQQLASHRRKLCAEQVTREAG
jgi:hypothetical protein